MKNQEQLPEEEITNTEQFQVDRNPDPQENQDGQNEAGYTPGETEFADGEGTHLDQETEELEINQENDEQEEDDPA